MRDLLILHLLSFKTMSTYLEVPGQKFWRIEIVGTAANSSVRERYPVRYPAYSLIVVALPIILFNFCFVLPALFFSTVS